MKVAETIQDVRRAVAAARGAAATIGLVPTMGALHEGHLRLIDAARSQCDFVVVSIFVNPLQFGPGEDLEAYPRPIEADLAACEARGVDVVFLPSAEVMYGRECLTKVTVEKLSGTLCGRSRPGHFAGVCTVVAKLFHIAMPDKAYFGAKDRQQAVILRRMAEDLDFPLEVVICPTVREADGLAMSSRNRYLTADERRQATALYGSLQLAERMIRQEHPPAEQVLQAIRSHLAEEARDATIDYVQIVDPLALSDVERTDRSVLIALAVKLGRARLIDNILVEQPEEKG
ncbi:MAG TPA: pantoate--beta-alanine ligase [Phycisphaerae bacterium]|nr:pantoate--beta-alanine ligase [Phycisphaerae bacterium]